MSGSVSRFWAGFFFASLLWGAAGAYLVLVAGFAPPEPDVVEPVAAEPAPAEEEPAAEPSRHRRRRGRRHRRRRGTQAAATPTGNATTGDDLNEDEARTIDMENGGEQQLSSSQIEAGFDSGMGRIRRCLVLMAGSDPVRGTVRFGLRVAPSGQVRAVQLSGPAAATTGEAGDCLRAAARGIHFDSFDEPEMVVHYPLHLE